MPFATVTGTVAPLGSSGMTLLVNASCDDCYIQIPLPFNFPFYAVNQTVFVGSNSYLTFGAGAVARSSFSATNPGRALLVGGGDHSYQRVYQQNNANGSVCIRFEGSVNTSGTVGSPNIVWEATLYTDGRIQLVVSTHQATTGAAFISNGTTSIPYTLAQNQSYVFEPSGTSYLVYTGYHVVENVVEDALFALVGSGGAVFGGYSIVPTTPVRSSVIQTYSLPFYLVKYLEQIYGIKALAILTQYYGDAAKVIRMLEQYYGDASLIRRAYAQLYSDAAAVRAILEKPYTLPLHLLKALEQQYTLSAWTITQTIAQPWDIKDISKALAFFAQPFGLLGDPGRVVTPTVSVRAGGVLIDPLQVSLEASRDQYCLSAEVVCATQAEYLACAVGVDLEITINGESYQLFVESRKRNRSHGSAEYTVQGLSKTARLDAPYAETITGELTGMASTIVADLAPGYVMDWRTVDWFIPPSTLLPSGETPLTVIRNIAQAAGAIVQTAPDGTLIIEPDYPLAVTSWETAPIDVHLSESLDFYTVAEEFNHRPGYNKYLISDQMTSQETSRIEEEAISETSKYIRGYRTPWIDDFVLRQTGGDWVVIEPLGIDEAEKTEVVEFVSGESKTAYPIYSIVSVSWLQTNLGSVTSAEDGRLSSAVDGESLLSITYRTKCAKWRVTDPVSEKVQFVLDEQEVTA